MVNYVASNRHGASSAEQRRADAAERRGTAVGLPIGNIPGVEIPDYLRIPSGASHGGGLISLDTVLNIRSQGNPSPILQSNLHSIRRAMVSRQSDGQLIFQRETLPANIEH